MCFIGTKLIFINLSGGEKINPRVQLDTLPSKYTFLIFFSHLYHSTLSLENRTICFISLTRSPTRYSNRELRRNYSRDRDKEVRKLARYSPRIQETDKSREKRKSGLLRRERETTISRGCSLSRGRLSLSTFDRLVSPRSCSLPVYTPSSRPLFSSFTLYNVGCRASTITEMSFSRADTFPSSLPLTISSRFECLSAASSRKL